MLRSILVLVLLCAIAIGQDSQQGTITIDEADLPPIQITSPPPDDGKVGVAYSHQWMATGGSGTYRWSWRNHPLPAGLQFNEASGILSGTPTASGSFPFDVLVEDGTPEPPPNGAAELPQLQVDVQLDPSYDRAPDIVVAAGSNLQAALNAVQPGQIIEIEAGATFLGNYTLRQKAGDDWIYIRSSRAAELPPGVRVTASESHLMATIESRAVNVPALATEKAAHHYRLIGIEFVTNKDDNQIVMLGPNYPNYETDESELAHHITFDRCYVHGHSEHISQTGIQAKGKHVGIVDCRISEIHHTGKDTQAVLCWNGAGPIAIENCYLEAAGENVMFGGADPRIQGQVPSDITISACHFFKPLAWKDPITAGPHAGKRWAVKNLFELKNARRVLLLDNVFENNWPAAQNGSGLQLTVRNQSGTAPWSVVEDVTFYRNHFRNMTHFVNISTVDSNHPSQTASRVTFINNLIEEVDGKMVSLVGNANRPDFEHLEFMHNTFVHRSTGSSFLSINSPAKDFVYQDNITTHGSYGVHVASGKLDDWLTDYTFDTNVVSGGRRNVPPDNWTDVAFDAIGFVDPENGNYNLRPDSPYKGMATNGTDVGINWR